MDVTRKKKHHPVRVDRQNPPVVTTERAAVEGHSTSDGEATFFDGPATTTPKINRAREKHTPATGAASSGLSFVGRAHSAAKKSLGVALLGLGLFALPSLASAQDMTGVQLTPVMTRLQQTTSTMMSQPTPIEAVFKFPALPEGKKLSVDGVFKTKKFLKTWTIDFTGDAQIIKSNARELTLHVTAIGTDGLFEGRSRVIELSWKQDGDSPQVRFLGREITPDKKDKDDDVGSLLIVTGVEDGGTQLMRVRDDRKAPTAKKDGVLITDDAGTLTIRYDQNVIRVKRPAGD